MNSDVHPVSTQAICANCRRRLLPLYSYDDAGEQTGVTFEHGLELPGVHCPEVVPIAIDTDDRSPDQVSVCDFCGAPGVAWDYPTADFMTPGDDGLLMTGMWSACDGCHVEIEALAWDRVAERHARFNRYHLLPRQRAHLIGIFRAFAAHRQGPATRI